MIKNKLNDVVILSLFPGIDLLGMAFENLGFCVVRGPDIITGGNIIDFNVPYGRFDAIIGGPPCQDFSRLNRNPKGNSLKMLGEYSRIVKDSGCGWYLFENVITAPKFEITGYNQQRFSLDLAWFTEFSRLRAFAFGTLIKGKYDYAALNPKIDTRGKVKGTCVTGADDRPFSECCEIQGLPVDFDIPFFSLPGKKQAVANAVPLALADHVANEIARNVYGVDLESQTRRPSNGSRCKCGCKRLVYGKAKYAGATCRKTAQRNREKLILKNQKC